MSAGETREEEALRRLNEAAIENLRRSRHGRPANITVVVEDGDRGREVDVDNGRSGVQVRYEPPGRR